MHQLHDPRAGERGISLVEISIAAALLTIVLFVVTSNSITSVRALQGMANVAAKNARVGDVLHGIEKLARGALGHRPSAWLTDDIGSTSVEIPSDSVRGFPPRGLLRLNSGTAGAEYVGYGRSINTTGYIVFDGLERGFRNDGNGRGHASGGTIRWGAFGEVLQGTPAPGTFDGTTESLSGTVFFRGEATGFVYQRSFVSGGSRVRGATVGGTNYTDGWYALYFEPVSVLEEAQRGDLNRDGDVDDTFDLGRLRRMAWAPIGGGTPIVDDIAASPTAIVQERGAWGTADLDGDGVSDPMFLWHERAAKLQIQLMLWVGRDGRANQFTKAESVIRLERSR